MENFHQFDSLSIFNKTYGLYKLVYKYLNTFPKKERYSLGENIEKTILELIETASIAAQLPKFLKEPELLKMNAKIQLLKILIRLACDIKALDIKKALILQEQLQEIGKMTGGWINFVRNNK